MPDDVMGVAAVGRHGAADFSNELRPHPRPGRGQMVVRAEAAGCTSSTSSGGGAVPVVPKPWM